VYSPSIVAIVPAKFSSDRVSQKNLRPLGGISLYQRSLMIADAAGVFEKIFLSSDEIPPLEGYEYHRRSPDLVGDVPASAVVRAVISDAFKSKQQWPEWTCLIQPTSPCLDPSSLQRAARICASDIDAVIACRAGEARPCGAFYFVRTHLVMRDHDWPALFARLNDIERCVWFPLSADESIDVDCHADLAMAELILEARKEFAE
jgi:CMP-N-acetylneuraminic acid synthetase